MVPFLVHYQPHLVLVVDSQMHLASLFFNKEINRNSITWNQNLKINGTILLLFWFVEDAITERKWSIKEKETEKVNVHMFQKKKWLTKLQNGYNTMMVVQCRENESDAKHNGVERTEKQNALSLMTYFAFEFRTAKTFFLFVFQPKRRIMLCYASRL